MMYRKKCIRKNFSHFFESKMIRDAVEDALDHARDMAQPSIKSPAEDGKNPKLYDLFMNKLTLKANLSGHFQKKMSM